MKRLAQLLMAVLFLAAVWLGRPVSVFAQERTPLRNSFQGQTVTAIEVKGNKSISSNTILSKLKTVIGSSYQDNVISEDLKRLYLLGYFSDIKIDTEAYKAGVKVVIIVVERPLIEKISFGKAKRRSISVEKLREEIKTKENQYLDYPTLAEDVEIIRALYVKKGFGQVQVEHAVEVNNETNKATVEYKITEGKRQKIRLIYVEGNMHFSDGRILKLIKTKRAWLFNSGALKEEVLNEDMDRIKDFYHRQGFIDATAEYELKVDPSARFIYITITVAEGTKYLVGSLTVRGNADITEQEILGKIEKCKPDKTFSYEALKDDSLKIQSLYFDRGYIMAQIQDTTSLNADTGRVDITFSIAENQVVYVDKIKIQGNVKTKDLVIRRELRIKPGDRFDGEKLRRSKERLQNLGYFEEVSYDTEETGVTVKKDLVVNVKETKTGAFSFGGGYSSVDQFVGFIELEQKNFDWNNFPYFTGAGQNLKLRASTGSLTQGFDLSFTEPWLFDYPVSFGFDAYKRTHERDEDVGYGYNEDVTGGAVRLGKEISEYVRADTSYRYDRIKISDITEDASQDLKDEAGTNNISSMNFGLTWDSRDNVFQTLRGDVFGNSVSVAGGPFGGDKNFWKFFTRYEHYIPLPRESVIELRARAGFAEPFSDTEKIPIYERFFAGGAYSVRGYEERSIGPVDAVSDDPLGGESMVIGNIEYVIPLVKFIRMGVFYDIGNVWEKSSDIGSGGYKSSTGLGFRIKTPIGPILLYYGIPLDKAPGEIERDDGRFHFSMGYGL